MKAGSFKIVVSIQKTHKFYENTHKEMALEATRLGGKLTASIQDGWWNKHISEEEWTFPSQQARAAFIKACGKIKVGPTIYTESAYGH